MMMVKKVGSIFIVHLIFFQLILSRDLNYCRNRDRKYPHDARKKKNFMEFQ